jgi:hypothetical protein
MGLILSHHRITLNQLPWRLPIPQVGVLVGSTEAPVVSPRIDAGALGDTNTSCALEHPPPTLPPPHTQQASLAVMPALAQHVPKVVHLVAASAAYQAHESPSLTTQPGSSVQVSPPETQSQAVDPSHVIQSSIAIG